MSQANIDALKRIARKVDGTFTDYSGRGMYGKSCAAISSDHPEECRDLALEAGIKGCNTDRLGKGWISYWPGIPYEGEEG